MLPIAAAVAAFLVAPGSRRPVGVGRMPAPGSVEDDAERPAPSIG